MGETETKRSQRFASGVSTGGLRFSGILCFCQLQNVSPFTTKGAKLLNS